MSTRGIVAAGDRHTAEAGALALAAGGNAIDAVCAAGFASFVAEPPLTSPAGAGVLLHGSADRGFRCLDFFAAVPGRDLVKRPPLDFQPVTVDFGTGTTTQTFHVGRAAAAVPGALHGLVAAHEAHGRLPLSDVLAPAVRLAREGFPVSAQIALVLQMLAPIVTLTPGVRRIYQVDGRLPVAGERMRNPQLADFLEEVGADPQGALMALEGLLLREVGPLRGGLMTAGDLAAHAPTDREPLRVKVGPYEVLTPPPPASGGSLVAFGLRLAEQLDLRSARFGSPEWVTAVARVLSATSALRQGGFDEACHDRAWVEALLTDEGLARWAQQAASTEEPGLGSTTHISVLDREGGAASLTTTNGEGCGHALPGLGIHVNNLLGEEDINPRGWHADPPGTWMTTMMAPTVVLQDGSPRLVLGSGGSNRIRSVVLETLLATLVHDLPLADAIAAPRLHVEGPRLWYEAADLAPDADAALAKWPGACRFEARNMFFGGVHAVALEDGELVGTADARRGGAVARA